MCGRYAFFQRASEIRRQLADSHMPSDEAPDDDTIRQSYNFAPGYYGLVYRAETSDYGAGPKPSHKGDEANNEAQHEGGDSFDAPINIDDESDTHYKLQAMKWGLIPSWTKRNPDYSTVMRTINCRSDSLAENRGMWTNMKKKKRCIVICNGFYEWLKKNNGKERIPHYIKRKDGQLMYFAGLWDVVKYDGDDNKNYTYTVITTEGNKQMSFLHDRMPVILEPGSEQITTWLSPKRFEWTNELQNILKPYEGELEIYPVTKEVGKVGNDSPTFIVPIDSKENKNNIANFFSQPGKAAKTIPEIKEEAKKDQKYPGDAPVEPSEATETTTQHIPSIKIEDENSETNAPIEVISQPTSDPSAREKEDSTVLSPKLESSPTKIAPTSASKIESSLKRSLDMMSESTDSPERTMKQAKTETSTTPVKPARKTHSATSNGTVVKSPAKGVPTKKITSFFEKK